MDNKQYITVSEFAERANISKQRVYQLLNKRLKEFVKVVDSKKMLDITALESFKSQEGCSNIQEGCSNIQEGCSSLEQEQNSTLDLLKTTIDMLQKQLEEKDKTIHELTEALKAEQVHASQAQALHAGTIKQSIEEKATPTKGNFLKRIFHL